MRAPAYSDGIHSVLVPTFRSSYTISAITYYELRKAMGTSKFMILVSLFDLKSLGSFRRLRCRDFKSPALEAPNQPAPSRFEITKAAATTPDQTQIRGSAPAVH